MSMKANTLDPFLQVEPFLRQQGVDDALRNLIFTIAHAGKYVAHSIRNEHLGYVRSANISGEKQRTLDVLSDQIFCEHLKSSELVSVFASEEQDSVVQIHGDDERFAVAFDPLDGSSLIDADLSIGSIFCVYPGNSFLGKKGKDMVAAGYIIYGPRTLFVVATRQGVWEFSENAIGEFVLSKPHIRVRTEAEYFAPGNLRSMVERPEYADLIADYAKRNLTLRYSGGMVPDIHLMLTKGSGIFLYPRSSRYPNGKLRVLFECAPFAFIVQMAGGIAKNEAGEDILEQTITELHQRETIIVGSRNEVNRSLGFLRR
jgi:fructose-1,6-bisphosphatase I